MSYINRPVPKAPVDTLAFSQDNMSTIVKKQLIEYIDSFLNTQGLNRNLTEILGSSSLQYITDLDLDDDPSERHIQLAALYEDIKEKLPSILLTDTSSEWIPSGLSMVDNVQYDSDNNRYEDRAFIYKIPITITVVTNSETATKQLNTLLSAMFGPMQNIAGGTRITSKEHGSTWVITLPLMHTPGSVTKLPIENSTVDHMWVAEFVPEVTFEHLITVKSQGTSSSRIVSGEIDGAITGEMAPTIIFPDSMVVGSSQSIQFENLSPYDSVLIDQSSIVAIWDKDTLEVNARKVGKFEIRVLNDKNVLKISKIVEVTLT